MIAMPEAPVLCDVYDKIRVVELQWIPMADGCGCSSCVTG